MVEEQRETLTSSVGPGIIDRPGRCRTVEEVLEQIFAFLATDRPFAELSRLTLVSTKWRTVSLNALKTAPQLNLSGFAEAVRDEDVRLALVRVTSENLKRVDLSGCHYISPDGIDYILHYIAETCPSVKEVDVRGCSNETVLRAVATRARAALGAPLALDLFVLLRSPGVEGMRYSLSNLCSLLLQPPPSCCLIELWLPSRVAYLVSASIFGESVFGIKLSSTGSSSFTVSKIECSKQA